MPDKDQLRTGRINKDVLGGRTDVPRQSDQEELGAESSVSPHGERSGAGASRPADPDVPSSDEP